MWKPNCVRIGCEISPGLSARAAFPYSGTKPEAGCLPRSPPLTAEAQAAYRAASVPGLVL